MAKTITLNAYEYEGSKKVNYADVAETSYAAGGIPVTAADVALGQIDSAHLPPTTSLGKPVLWDQTNKKIKVMQGSGRTTQIFPDIKGGNQANQAASGAAGVNDAYVRAAANFVTTLVNTSITNPDTPRNLKVVLSSAAGGTLPADCGTCTLIGTDQFDAAVTEVLSLAALNGVVLGASGIVFIVGAKVFKTLTSVQFSVDLEAGASPDDIQFSIGLGTKIGLQGKIAAEGDIRALQKNTAAVAAATYVGDATYHYVDPGANLADNDELYVEYLSTTDVEVPAATNVGTVAGARFRGI